VNPYDVLGLPPGADERAVKRAYARKLKSTRPDTDPQGFQILHEAYQRALTWSREHAAETATVADAADDVVPTITLSAPVEAALASPVAALRNVADGTPAHRETEPVREAHVQPVIVADEPSSVVEIPATPPAVVRDERSADERNVAPEPDKVTADGPMPAAPAGQSRGVFDFRRFFDGLAAVAARGDPDAVEAYLHAEPALWSLGMKTRVGHAVLEQLFESRPKMPDEAFDAILRFFDFDHVLAGQNPLVLDHLRRQLRCAWYLDPANDAALISRFRLLADAAKNRSALRRAAHLLARPFGWRETLYALLLHPACSGQTASLLRQLGVLRPEDIETPLDPRQIKFWLESADRQRMTLPRFAVGAAIAARLAGGALVTGVAASLLTESGQYLHTLIAVAALAVAGIGLWLLYVLWLVLAQWQCVPAVPLAREPRLRLAFLPLLGVLGIAARHLVAPAAALPFIVPGLLLAFVRYRRRAGLRALDFSGWRLLLWIFAARGILALFTLATYLPEIGAGLILMLWAWDLWKQRERLRAA